MNQVESEVVAEPRRDPTPAPWQTVIIAGSPEHVLLLRKGPFIGSYDSKIFVAQPTA